MKTKRSRQNPAPQQSSTKKPPLRQVQDIELAAVTGGSETVVWGT